MDAREFAPAVLKLNIYTLAHVEHRICTGVWHAGHFMLSLAAKI